MHQPTEPAGGSPLNTTATMTAALAVAAAPIPVPSSSSTSSSSSSRRTADPVGSPPWGPQFVGAPFVLMPDGHVVAPPGMPAILHNNGGGVSGSATSGGGGSSERTISMPYWTIPTVQIMPALRGGGGGGGGGGAASSGGGSSSRGFVPVSADARSSPGHARSDRESAANAASALQQLAETAGQVLSSLRSPQPSPVPGASTSSSGAGASGAFSSSLPAAAAPISVPVPVQWHPTHRRSATHSGETSPRSMLLSPLLFEASPPSGGFMHSMYTTAMSGAPSSSQQQQAHAYAQVHAHAHAHAQAHAHAHHQQRGAPVDGGAVDGDSDNAPWSPDSADGGGGASAAASAAGGGAPTRAYRCPMAKCGRSFRRMEHLKRHIRIHTGEKPYPCREEGCHKSFSRADNLAQHMRTHQERAMRSAMDVRWNHPSLGGPFPMQRGNSAPSLSPIGTGAAVSSATAAAAAAASSVSALGMRKSAPDADGPADMDGGADADMDSAMSGASSPTSPSDTFSPPAQRFNAMTPPPVRGGGGGGGGNNGGGAHLRSEPGASGSSQSDPPGLPTSRPASG